MMNIQKWQKQAEMYREILKNAENKKNKGYQVSVASCVTTFPGAK